MTGQAWLLTGPSVILGYLVLSPAILATSVPYAVFLSTSLGRDPGGEYTHISRTFGGYGVAFVGAWLKAISYLGALAFLSLALADYLLELAGARERSLAGREAIALAALGFFFAVHAVGVRWFGRIQVAMCAVLGVSILVLVIPGLFALQPANYRPFFTHGWSGFAAALPPLFFAYAGFESLAQTAGEVRDSTRRLPGIFLRGIAATTVVYLFMSVVAFGTLPGERLGRSAAPMAEVGAVYLPWGAAWFVTLGAVMAVATSLNVTMLAPSRVGIMLARDGLAPSWLGAIERRTGTPVPGLASTFVISALLLLSGQVSLALNIAVFALVLLYFLHSLAFLLLPRLNPALYQEATVAIPLSLQRLAAVVSLFAMGAIVVVQVMADVRTLRAFDLAERVARRSLTTLELCVLWSAVGAVLYALGRRQAGGAVHGLVGQGRKEA
ncbi:MAG: amino acid permease [Acidobacteria bacterium]|nr:MAG: amino acid permease [Acidobacteriota bacterium]